MGEHKRMKISDLKPHPKNEEIYGKNENISDLVEKIKRSGQVHTLVVTSKGIVLAGHRRLKACRELEIEEVDVEVLDFDTPEQEVEYLIDNNATREKTNEQKAREAVVLKQTLSILAEKRKKSKLKQNCSVNSSSNLASRNNQITDVPNSAPRNNQITDTTNSAEQGEGDSVIGKTREVVAKRVGLKSGHEVDRAINTIKKVDEFKKEGRDEEAELITDVMNNRSISAAESLAKNIDNIKLSEEEKEDIRSGRKSPNSFIKKDKRKEQQKLEEKPVESYDKVKNLETTLSVIQQRYHDYLLYFQQDIEWLSNKEFYRDDEEVSGKTHSELQNCLEKLKSISEVMEKMVIDEFGCITIKK